MCGIWALFGVADEDIPKYCKDFFRISHRGPDATRIETVREIPHACLGFHRLAITDQTHGMQPLRVRAHPHIWLLYNGEIYNAFSLRDHHRLDFETECDAEIIIHLYERFGVEQAARMLDGTFAFALLDTTQPQVHLGRDLFGVRPLFTFFEAGTLGVCSEAKGLLHPAGDRKAEIRPFTPGFIQSYDIDSLGAASFVSSKRFLPIGGSDPSTAVTLSSCRLTNVRILLKDAVKKRLLGNRRIGCLLSGGLDSSLVTALVVECIRESGYNYSCKENLVQTFSIGMKGSPDVEFAQVMAKYLETEHHEISITPDKGLQAVRDVIFSLESYDVITIRSALCHYLVSKYIKENTDTTVLFSGEGSDELCQGYIYFHKASSPDEGDKESRHLLHDLYLYDNLRADRTTAAHGLELRVPFLDKFFTSYYLSLPGEDRQPKEGIEKYFLRKAFSDTGLLPEEVLWRPRVAFSDGISSKDKSWYAHLQERIEEKISDDMLAEASKNFTGIIPKTKEAYYYRQVFEELFPNCGHLIPNYWMPKWISTSDPSARVLEHYR